MSTSELLFNKASRLKSSCSFATQAWHTSLRIVHTPINIMLSYIKRLLKVLHSSFTKVIELYLEIVYSIPKPLQLIWVHSIGNLGFRLRTHHYPSNPSLLLREVLIDLWNQPFLKRFSWACDPFGWVWLDLEVWHERDKPICIKILIIYYVYIMYMS